MFWSRRPRPPEMDDWKLVADRLAIYEMLRFAFSSVAEDIGLRKGRVDIGLADSYGTSGVPLKDDDMEAIVKRLLTGHWKTVE